CPIRAGSVTRSDRGLGVHAADRSNREMTSLLTRLSTQTWGLSGDITCKAVNYISGRFACNSFSGNILPQWPGAESNCRHADFQSLTGDSPRFLHWRQQSPLV